MKRAAISFIAGVIILQQSSLLPDYKIIIFCSALICLFAILRYRCLIFFILGYLYATAMAHERLANRLPSQLEGDMHIVTGKIKGLPKINDHYARFDFEVDIPAALPKRIRLNWYYPEMEIAPGQTWQFQVKLKQPYGLQNPGSFDYEKWLFLQGIGATGYVRNKPSPRLISNASPGFNINLWRQRISLQLQQLSQHHPAINLVKALTIGDKQNIPAKQWDLFRRTGTTHLMAISGLHIGLVSGLVYFFILRCWAYSGILSIPPPRLAAIVALLAGVFYAALAGFAIPTQRALIMLLIFSSAKLLQRHVRIQHTLILTMLAVVLINPWSVLSSGFWLSFSAVTAIIFSVAARLGSPGYFVATLKIHWVTTIALTPLLLFFFQQASLLSPMANFIAVPLISFIIVPLSLISVALLSWFPEISTILLKIVTNLLDLLLTFLQLLAEFPYAQWHTPIPPLWLFCFILPAIVLLLAPRGIPGRRLSILLLLPLILHKPEKPANNELFLTLLDVGQGLSAVVQTQNNLLIYDTGAHYPSGFNLAQNVILPFLRSQDLREVDALVVSHGDNDHSGGANTLLQALPVKTLITSVPERFDDRHPLPCTAGQQWIWDNILFTILAPPKQGLGSENNNSCVLQIRSKFGTILLTGDIEKTAEDWLMQHYGSTLGSEIMLAPHHGSNTSSTSAFIRQVNPKITLNSAGYRNRYAFPHKEVIKRYQLAGSYWYNSAEEGAIKVVLGTQGTQVTTYHDSDKHYWSIH